MQNVLLSDCVEFAKNWHGDLFHGMFCDAPYHLTNSNRSTPPPHNPKSPFSRHRMGVNGDSRAERGVLGHEWDGGDIAFRPETWKAFMDILYPGAFGMTFGGARTFHRMAVAIEDAGFIIHPTIFLWAYGQGLPKGVRIDKQIEREFGGDTKVWVNHRYGLQAMKPAVEPIILFQKPYDGRPFMNIYQTGAGALNIAGERAGNRLAANLVLEGEAEKASKFFYQVREQLDEADPLYFCKKADRNEREGGLDNVVPQTNHRWGTIQDARPHTREGYTYNAPAVRNSHPTVKPIDLNRHLAALLLPPVEYAPRRLFVPFAGVASEVLGAIKAGWEEVVGVENQSEYISIANQRIEYWRNKWLS